MDGNVAEGVGGALASGTKENPGKRHHGDGHSEKDHPGDAVTSSVDRNDDVSQERSNEGKV
eukprot:11521247-Alexandrium_andersonii.AAC.1